jgi:hypothetical protein
MPLALVFSASVFIRAGVARSSQKKPVGLAVLAIAKTTALKG